MINKINEKKNLIYDISIIFLSILPLWLFENKNYLNIQILIFFLFLVLFFVLSSIILKKKKLYKFHYFLLSIFVFYGYDSKIGFYKIVPELLKDQIQLIKYFIPTIFVIISIILIFKLLIKSKKFKEFFIFSILSIFIFNIYFFKNFENKSFELENFKLKENELINSSKKKDIIIILDSYICLDAIDENIPYGIKAKRSIENLFSVYNFTLYSSSYSIYENTFRSLSSIFNFDFQTEKLNHDQYVKKVSNDRLSLAKMIKNEFFNLYNDKNKILSYKSIMNFCESNKTKCLYSNPVNNYKKYINGFNFSTFDYVINKTHNQKSLLFQYAWRAGMKINLFKFNSYLVFDKAKISNTFKDYSNIIKNTNHDVYLLHLIIPHPPYVFKLNENEKKCTFSQKVYNTDFAHYSAEAEKILEQYYKEIICTNYFLNEFLKDLSEEKSLSKNTRILIFSDHGIPINSRKDLEFKNAHSTLFAIKNEDNKFEINKEVVSSQELFSRHFNTDHDKKNSSKKMIYDEKEKKFIALPFFN